MRDYLAPNTEELCFLLFFLFHLKYRIDIVSEDNPMQFDTIHNPEQQREALVKMANDYVSLNRTAYSDWENKLREAMNKLACSESAEREYRKKNVWYLHLDAVEAVFGEERENV